MARTLIVIGLLVVVLSVAWTLGWMGTAPEAEPCVENCEVVEEDLPASQMPGQLVSIELSEVLSVGAVTITPLTLVEDSRCPVGVECVQAGTVVVSTRIDSAMGTDERDMKLGEFVTTETEKITFIGVTPALYDGVTLADADYRFVFVVENRMQQ